MAAAFFPAAFLPATPRAPTWRPRSRPARCTRRVRPVCARRVTDGRVANRPSSLAPRPASRFPPGRRFPGALELDWVLNHPVSDAIVAALVVLACFAFALQTLDLGPALNHTVLSFEKGVSSVFVIEYFCRWYAKGLDPRFLFTKGMIIDLLAIAPLAFAIADQSEATFVRILRISRIFRLQRMMEGGEETGMFGDMTEAQIRLANVALSVFSLLYCSAGLFYDFEKNVNPAADNFFTCFYYAVVTLFTVGFGDVTPLTGMGKAVTVLTVLTGAVLIPFQLTEVERARQVAARAAEETRFAEREAQIYKRVEPTRAPPPAASLLPPYSVDIECRDCHLRGHQLDARYCRNCGVVLVKRRFD